MRRRGLVLALAGLAGCGSGGSRSGRTTAGYTVSVSFQVAEPVAARVVAVDAETDETVYDERHEFDRADQLTIDDAFDRGRDYEVRVFVGGEKQFERPVYSYESYVLRIADGEVTVESHGEA